MLQEAAEGVYIGEVARRAWAPPETAVSSARRRMVPEREGEGNGVHAGAMHGRGRAQEQGGKGRTQCAGTVPLAGPCPCSLRRAPASASARGKLRGWRRGWWRGGDMLWLAEQRARAQQRRWRCAERAFGMPAPSGERGHRVDRDIRPHMH